MLWIFLTEIKAPYDGHVMAHVVVWSWVSIVNLPANTHVA